MKLVNDWQNILKRAWSIRLMIAAGILSGVETILPFFSDALPRGLFAVLSFGAVAAAFVARLLAQKEFGDA